MNSTGVSRYVHITTQLRKASSGSRKGICIKLLLSTRGMFHMWWYLHACLMVPKAPAFCEKFHYSRFPFCELINPKYVQVFIWKWCDFLGDRRKLVLSYQCKIGCINHNYLYIVLLGVRFCVVLISKHRNRKTNYVLQR